MNRVRLLVARIALVLAVAGCDTATIDSWDCDVTITVDGRTASGSGSGSTREEAEGAALAVACPKLGLTGERLSACKAGRHLGLGSSVETDWDCKGRS
ncbi:MAG: hypothetical protein OXQ94_12645 [Gemmatimonadota bacterium]|nr:hypothetical protein [Gemmatimonadota bacterium]MDE2872521.1 hypothetical protein [Gemmatimonadota bacterium]